LPAQIQLNLQQGV